MIVDWKGNATKNKGSIQHLNEAEVGKELGSNQISYTCWNIFLVFIIPKILVKKGILLRYCFYNKNIIDLHLS